MSHGTRSHDAYGVGIICALPLEKAAVTAMLDEEHPRLRNKDGDDSDYTLGRIGEHNVVVACLPAGMTGRSSASTVAINMLRSFPIKIGLMVGIGGGVPSKNADIRLGDVVVSQPTGMHGGVVQWDFGKMEKGRKFRRTGTLNKPPKVLLHALGALQARHEIEDSQAQKYLADLLATRPKMAKSYGYQGWDNDWLFPADYDHEDGGDETCESCDRDKLVQRKARDEGMMMEIHYGNIASGDEVMRDGKTRDDIALKEQVLCFEMEAAGLMDSFPCLVIRGICDYADSHKNKRWQRYAAAAAAAYAKELLGWIDAEGVEELKPVGNKHWVVPRRASPQFSGYSDLSSRLKDRLLPSNNGDEGSGQRVFVLSGMGGVGKSENVLQFAERYRDRFWGVFWIDCGSETSTQTDFERVAQKCGWTNHDKSTVVDGVREHLSNSVDDFLLVLDNCDDANVDYALHIPSGSRGKIVITTRLPECSRFASEDDSNLQDYEPLEGLDPDSALNLVLKESRIAIPTTAKRRTAGMQLVKMLGFHPLAIIVAGAVVRDGICPLEEYPSMFEGQKADFLEQETRQMGSRYRSIFKTLEVSAQALQKSQDPAAQLGLALLGIIGFMHRQDVREDIFTRAWEYEEQLIDTATEEEDDDIRYLSHWHVAQSRNFINIDSTTKRVWSFRRARAWLIRLSLANSHGDNSSISVHPLVHEWARLRIEPQHCGQTWATAASILALSTEETSDWQPYLVKDQQHIETCIHIGFETDFFRYEWDLRETCRLLYTFAWQLYFTTSIVAMQVIIRLEEKCKDFADWSPESAQFLDVQYLLGLCLQDARRDAEAVEILREVVCARERTLGASDPDRLASQQALAIAYQDNGQVAEAVEILEHVVEVEKALAEDHPSRLASQHALAIAYQANGQVERAIPILENVVEVEKALRADYPSRLTSQHELAIAYQANGQVERAIPILENVVKIEKALGESPLRLVSQNALLGAYLAAERYQEAEELRQNLRLE